MNCYMVDISVQNENGMERYMMRKSLFVFISIVIMLALSACTNQQTKVKKREMVINIENRADFDWYSIEIEVENTRSGMANANGSKIKKGDGLTRKYIDKEDFPLTGKAEFEFTLIGKNGKRITLEAIELNLLRNKEYQFEIIGATLEDAELIILD